MNGFMMQQPLLISLLLVHAERHHGEQQVVSRRVEGDIHRQTYRELVARRAGWPTRWRRWLASATASPPWSGTATATWSCTTRCQRLGRGLHTHEPAPAPGPGRLIADHAEDRCCSSTSPSRRWSSRWPRAWQTVAFVLMTDRAHMPAGPAACPACCATRTCWRPPATDYEWPRFDENRVVAVLHERHHRQPEGRALQPPLDRCCTPMPRRCPTR